VRFDDETLNLYVFIHRLGVFAPDGEPVALHAIAAENRTAPALTQRELLDRAAALGDLPSAEAVVEEVFRDLSRAFQRAAAIRERAQPFAHDGWTPFTWTRAPGSPEDPVTAQ
jgi:hypothetical protein